MKKYLLFTLASLFSYLTFAEAANLKQTPVGDTTIVACEIPVFTYQKPTVVSCHFQPTTPANKIKEKPATIQVALLLDTSNSMDGLIDQAKSQLWKMVNELATAKKSNLAPNIEIALYRYGNSGLSVEKGYVEQIVPLTTDLDLISEKLFQLTTKGGDEYCGWVIKDAGNELTWSNKKEDLKLMIIAGNEPFNQGPVNFRATCQSALERGIMINTIHCGDYQQGINDLWKEGADLTDGKYMNINQDDHVIHIPTPYDTRINELNIQLNKTYIGYGTTGIEKASNQVAQDLNAASYGAANARTRAAFKAKESYSNASWDLVDASEDNEVIIEEVSAEELPEAMKNLSIAERKEYVKQKRAERNKIKKEILELEKKARAFEAEERKNNSEQLTLDNVLIDAVKEQAVKKAFIFK